MKYPIRKSKQSDLAQIMPVYESAKRYMRSQGNLSQWADSYPALTDILSDINNGNHYLIENNYGDILGVFSFIIGPDPTYSYIEGRWLNDAPYGTIHRIASSGKEGGVLEKCVDYCKEKINNIRIDTHIDNKSMLTALSRLNFTRCGIIYLANGSPREAFQKVYPYATSMEE